MKTATHGSRSWLDHARTVVAAAVLVLVWCDTSKGVIIVDDFDDPALVEEVDGVVISDGVGDLSASRRVTFQAVQQAFGAAGRLDVGTDDPAIATATLTSAGILPLTGFVSAAFHFRYGEFYGTTQKTVDFTEGGMNDAVIVDVLSITGETRPRIVRARAISDNGGPQHDNIILDLPHNTDPFRLIFPFEDFVPRRGLTNVPLIDFERITRVELAFGSNFLETRGQVEQWEIKLGRIWVGQRSAVPEPHSMEILFFAAACGALRLVLRVSLTKGSCVS